MHVVQRIYQECPKDCVTGELVKLMSLMGSLLMGQLLLVVLGTFLSLDLNVDMRYGS